MLDPGTLLQNRYLIEHSIGQGGMGAVYRATDQRLRSTVALKETFFTDEALRRAFEREARLLASLRHPALPVVMDYFDEGDKEFLVMQYIPGEDLSEMMARQGGAFSAREVLAWADQLLDALDYLHTQDPPIIHRDIKPQNLKLTGRNQIVLLDFGLAKGSAGLMTRASSSGSSVFGYTPHYAPLEQIQGTGTDTRSDLYSLAATLLHLLTGVKPPDALSRVNAVVNGETDPLLPANELNPQVPATVASVLMQAMSLKRDQRPVTADELRKRLGGTRQPSAAVPSYDRPTIISPNPASVARGASANFESLSDAATEAVRPAARAPAGQRPVPPANTAMQQGAKQTEAASVPPAVDVSLPGEGAEARLRVSRLLVWAGISILIVALIFVSTVVLTRLTAQ